MSISKTFKTSTYSLRTSAFINQYMAICNKYQLLNLEIPFVMYLWNNNLVVRYISDKLYYTLRPVLNLIPPRVNSTPLFQRIL